jgi:preprotein translocase subunit SecB
VTTSVREEDRSLLQFDRVVIREAAFVDVEDAEDSVDAGTVEIKLEVRVTVGADGRRAFVLLRLILEPPIDKVTFRQLNGAVEGSFTVSDGDASRLADFAHMQAPVLLLPYARAVISSLTAMSRFGAVVVPPLNMMSIVSEMAEKAKASLGAQAERR